MIYKDFILNYMIFREFIRFLLVKEGVIFLEVFILFFKKWQIIQA